MAFDQRNWKMAVWRGAAKSCPACGDGPLFASYAKTHNTCSHCDLPFTHHRADDAPPYFTIMVVGHIVIPLMLVVEKLAVPPLWVHAVLWLPLTLLGTLWLLPRLKGATIGLQWAFGMHGFGADNAAAEPPLKT